MSYGAIAIVELIIIVILIVFLVLLGLKYKSFVKYYNVIVKKPTLTPSAYFALSPPTPIPLIPTNSCGNYVTIPHTNIPGFNITSPTQPILNSTEANCQQTCSNSDCDFYSYDSNSNTCYLKKIQTDPNITTGFKVADPKTCNPYTRFVNGNIPGFDLPNGEVNTSTEKICQDLCSSNTNCDFYTYDTPNTNCKLKQGIQVKNIDTGFLTQSLNTV